MARRCCISPGSKAHNVVLRQLAQQRGLKLNEYGLFRGEVRIAGETEESVYAAVGSAWIPRSYERTAASSRRRTKGGFRPWWSCRISWGPACPYDRDGRSA